MRGCGAGVVCGGIGERLKAVRMAMYVALLLRRAMVASVSWRCGGAVWCRVMCRLSSFRAVDAALLCVCVYELSCGVGCAGTLRVTALAHSLTGVA
jgi:hypothetical protein